MADQAASLQRGKKTHHCNECPGYNIKKSDGDASDLEVRGMQSTSSLALFSGPLCTGVVIPDRVQSMGQMELFDI